MKKSAYAHVGSPHLDKAKAALEHAAEMDVDLTEPTLPPIYLRLLDLALVQANVAQAEALTRLAGQLQRPDFILVGPER